MTTSTKNKVLILSFDFHRPGEPKQPYSIASILAYLQSKKEITEKYAIETLSVDLLSKDYRESADTDFLPQHLNDYSFIAIGAYVWSDEIVKRFPPLIKSLAPEVKIIIGGYQLGNYRDLGELQKDYPEVDHFIQGPGEQGLYAILSGTHKEALFTSNSCLSDLPSPYLTGTIKLDNSIRKVRLETERGCPYKCEYCQWRKVSKKIVQFSISRFAEELKFISDYPIDKVNMLNGTFNHKGANCVEIIEMMSQYPHILFAVQTYPDDINEAFISACEKAGNIYLEIGIQTTVKAEMEVINRKNDMGLVEANLRQLIKRKIPFEVNLIYGIPGQTGDSFRDGVAKLRNIGLKKEQIICFHLQVPKGSKLDSKDVKLFEMGETPKKAILEKIVNKNELFAEKTGNVQLKYKMKEVRQYVHQPISPRLIKESPSFSKEDLFFMGMIAETLQYSSRDANHVDLPRPYFTPFFKYLRISFGQKRSPVKVVNNITSIKYFSMFGRTDNHAYLECTNKPLDILESFQFQRKPVNAYIYFEDKVYAVIGMCVSKDTLKVELDVDALPLANDFVIHDAHG